MIPAERWQLAVCAQVDADLFFPEPGHTTRYAVALCRVCPIIAECLAEAKRTHVTSGIWGGQNFGARNDRPQDHRDEEAEARHQKRLALYRQGMSDQQIASHMHLSKSTITSWRQSRGLRPNTPGISGPPTAPTRT